MSQTIIAAIFGIPFLGLAVFLVAVNWRSMTAPPVKPKPYWEMELDELERARARWTDPRRAEANPDGAARRLLHIDQHIAHRRRRMAEDAAEAARPRARRIVSPSEMGEVYPSSSWVPPGRWHPVAGRRQQAAE